MDINDLKKTANHYDELNWPFSSAMEWQKISKIKPTAFNLVQYADRLRLSGKFIEAEALIKNIDIKDIPTEYKFVYYDRLGMIYQDSHQINKAIRAYKKCIKIGTTETYPYIFLAVLLAQQNKLDESEQLLTEAVNKNGDIDEAYYNLGRIKARQGDFHAAINMLKECLKIDINYPNAQTFLEDFENMLDKS